MIKKENNLYFVYNKEGTKKLSKGYETEEEAKKRLQEIETFKDENIKGTYVARKVKNKKDLYEWFKNQNIDMLDIDDLHSTISYSKKEFTPNINKEDIIIKKDNFKEITPLGDDGAVVLKFDSKEMKDRFYDCISRGAIFDYDYYKPHITLTYNGKDLDIKNLRMPNFDIILGDEYTEVLDLNWKDKIIKDNIFTIDKGFTDYSKYIDESTGFLHINGIVARTGIQEYLGLELGDTENPTKSFGVYRPKEEVLKQESLDTYINSIVTDNHPNEFVTTDNIKELGKGSTSSIETFSKDGIDYIKAKMTITDKNLINKVMSGKVEISAGYSQDLIKEKGEFQGKQYDYKQTNIKINHVAIVERGRCGDKCKITTDKKVIIKDETKQERISMIKLKIGDAEVEVCDTVFSHINSLKDTIADRETKLKDAESSIQKLEGEKAKMEEDMEEEKKKTSDSLVNTLVAEKVALIDTAKQLNVTVDAMASSMDIKKAVITANSKISLDGKSDEFIDGVYETVLSSTIGKKQAIKDSQEKAFDGFEGKKQTTNDAYEKYVDGLKNNYKGDK